MLGGEGDGARLSCSFWSLKNAGKRSTGEVKVVVVEEEEKEEEEEEEEERSAGASKPKCENRITFQNRIPVETRKHSA